MAVYNYSTLLNGLQPELPIVSGAALNTSTSEAIISPSSATFPDFTFGLHCPPIKVGDVFRFIARGIYSTTSNPTLELRLRYGGLAGTLLLDTTAVTAQTTVTNTSWKMTGEIVCRSSGTSGTVVATGETVGIAGAGTTALLPATGLTTTTINTTTQNALVLTGQWGTNSASNSVQVLEWLIEALN